MELRCHAPGDCGGGRGGGGGGSGVQGSQTHHWYLAVKSVSVKTTE